MAPGRAFRRKRLEERSDWSHKGFGRMGVSRAVRINPLKFTVEAQRAVYLGNFDPSMSTGGRA